MVFTLYKDGSLLKNQPVGRLYHPIGRTLRPSVDCPGGGGGRTFYPSGGQFALVQNVRGDIVP